MIAIGFWLARSPRRLRAGRVLIAAGALLLLLLSNNLVSFWLIRPLEGRYPAIAALSPGIPPPAALAACRYVVVLGGGHADIAALPAASQLSPSSLARLVEGVRILRMLPQAELIVSGPPLHPDPGPGNPSHASILAAAAVSLGIDPSRIRLIESARDTEQESFAVRKIAGDDPVALVTSAWHMPRAAADFEAAGVHFVPCPADFKARMGDDFLWTDVSWDVDSLERSTAAIHERLGSLWMRLRGAKVERDLRAR